MIPTPSTTRTRTRTTPKACHDAAGAARVIGSVAVLQTVIVSTVTAGGVSS